jgi:hypothetical protein
MTRSEWLRCASNGKKADMDANGDGAVARPPTGPSIRPVERNPDPFRLRGFAYLTSERAEPISPWPPRIFPPLPDDPADATNAQLQLLESVTLQAYEETRTARWRLERAQRSEASPEVLEDFREAIAQADRDYDELLAALLFAAEVLQLDGLTRERVEAIFDGRDSREPAEDAAEPTAASSTVKSGPRTKPMTQKERKALLERIESSPAWSRLKRREKDVLAHDLLRHGERMFSAHKTLAAEIGCSERTVRRARDGLVDQRVLLREFRRRDNGSRTSNLYVLNGSIFGS